MFESWNARYEALPYRVVDPPMPVTIRFGDAFRRRPAKLGPGGITLRVRNEGLNVDAPVEGQLHATASARNRPSNEWPTRCGYWLFHRG